MQRPNPSATDRVPETAARPPGATAIRPGRGRDGGTVKFARHASERRRLRRITPPNHRLLKVNGLPLRLTLEELAWDCKQPHRARTRPRGSGIITQQQLLELSPLVVDERHPCLVATHGDAREVLTERLQHTTILHERTKPTLCGHRPDQTVVPVLLKPLAGDGGPQVVCDRK